MSQLNISIFTSYFRIFIVLFILIICINKNQASLDNNDKTEEIELNRRGVWPRLFRNEINQRRIHSRTHHSPTDSEYVVATGQIHIIPYDKRTIPIELQKALYAHGIVGRRR